jgi:undecaprenyl-diphosphatase
VTFLAAVVLGIVQGLTEFLPVSSSAHLILGRAFFGWDAGALGLAFDVACHLGTLLAVIIFFRAELMQMVAALPRSLTAIDPTARLIRLIVVGTLPTVVAGLLYTHEVEAALRTPLVAAVTLILGGVLMLVAERVGRAVETEQALGTGGALAIGAGQAAALVPGMSRSGTTISIGLFLGLRRDAAARFTFLLSIPAILAAGAKEGLELARIGVTGEAAALFAVGMIVSGVVGYLTIRFFLRYLAGHRLDVFAYYRFALAAATCIWLSTRA